MKVASPKSDAILVTDNKRINADSIEASWDSQWEAAQVLLYVSSYDFHEMGYFTEKHDGHMIKYNMYTR